MKIDVKSVDMLHGIYILTLERMGWIGYTEPNTKHGECVCVVINSTGSFY